MVAASRVAATRSLSDYRAIGLCDGNGPADVRKAYHASTGLQIPIAAAIILLDAVGIKRLEMKSSGEATEMPIYEYVCQACGHAFEVLLRGDEKPICPACGKKRLKKQFSVPAAHTSTGQSACPAQEAGFCNPSGGCCGGGGCDLGGMM